MNTLQDTVDKNIADIRAALQQGWTATRIDGGWITIEPADGSDGGFVVNPFEFHAATVETFWADAVNEYEKA